MTRTIIVASLLLVSVATSGCMSDSVAKSTRNAQVGNALATGSPQSGATLTMNRISVGDRIRLSFPVLTNRGNQPITVTGAMFVSIPSTVKLLSYRRFTINPKVGHLIAFRIGDPVVRGYGALPKPYASAIHIGPNSTSSHYYAADVRILRLNRGFVSGCRIFYAIGSVHYAQTLGCRFGFK